MKTVRMYVLVVLLCLALAITATVVWGRAQTTGQTDFQTNGNLIAGSYWLRSSGHTATWTFDVSQLQGRKVYINFNPLVTNGVNGGAGYDTTCKATVKIGPKTATMSIPVVNPYRPIDPANSGGVGYQCYGHSSSPVSPTALKAGSTMTVTISYPFPKGCHVAVNKDSMYLGYSR